MNKGKCNAAPARFRILCGLCALVFLLLVCSKQSIAQTTPEQLNPRLFRQGDIISISQSATDADLVQLPTLRGIKSIRFNGMKGGAAGPFITDAGLTNLEGLSDLQEL